MNDLLTRQSIATFSGIVLAVNVVTQFTKNRLQKMFPRVTTKCWVYCYSLIILITLDILNGCFDLMSLFLCILNAFGVGLAAMSSFDHLLVHICTDTTTDEERNT